MSKKHYQAIAAIMYSAQAHRADWSGAAMLRSVARDLADYMAADNPRFDRARFLAACGVEQ